MDAAVTTVRPAGDVEALVRLAAPDMAAVNALIAARMQSDVPVIPALADHLIAAGGKRLRPLLTLAAARALNGGGEKAHKLAAAVEFIHTATLLHDDVVDGSEMRRSKVAAHLIWGSPSSVLVGDFLFARAFELMVETDSLRALHILARASAVIAEGEVLQLTRSRDLRLDQAVYLQIVQAKTAELFAAAAESGAVAAGAPDDQVAALRAYGMNLGLAFQLVDDALDYGGSSEALGKNAGDDDLGVHEALAVMNLADEVLDHLLGDFEVGDDPVAHRTDRFHVTGRAAQHLLGLDADSVDDLAAADVAQRDHRRLVEHDALALHVNQGVGGAEIDGDIVRNHSEQCKHGRVFLRRRGPVGTFSGVSPKRDPHRAPIPLFRLGTLVPLPATGGDFKA